MSNQPEPNSDKELLAKLKLGQKSAADELIAKYFDRVIRAARRRIGQRRLRSTGAEDIAASVFESLWKKADQGQFDAEDLITPEEFWRLLCTMVRFKTEDHLRREAAKKRGAGRQRGESAFAQSEFGDQAGLAGFSNDEISPSELAAFHEQHDKFMDCLKNQVLQEIVTMRLEGHKVADIAQRFDKSERWVKRKLALIREIWSAELDK